MLSGQPPYLNLLEKSPASGSERTIRQQLGAIAITINMNGPAKANGINSARQGSTETCSPDMPFASPAVLNKWWDTTGQSLYRSSILGDAEIAPKATSTFLLDFLVRTNVLDPSRFGTPPSFVIASDAVSRSRKRHIRTVEDRTDILAAFSRSRTIGESLLEAKGKLHLNPNFLVMVRSLGMAEGNAGKSAAGIFTSTECVGSLSAMRSAAQRVVESAFSAEALLLNREYALPDRFPGLLIQPKLRGTHCVFHTSRPGQVSSEIKGHTHGFPICEPIGQIAKWSRYGSGPPIELRERVHEAANILSCGGKVPVEVELVYDHQLKRALLLQHRIVTSLSPQLIPTGAPAFAETDNVVGANSLSESWIVDMRRTNYDSSAGLWLMQKELRARGVKSFAVLMTSGALSTMSGREKWQRAAVFAPLRLGTAYVEHDGGVGHESSSDSHELRLAYDKGAISLYMDFDVSKIRALKAEEILPNRDLWHKDDALFLADDVVKRIDEDLTDCGVRCYRVIQPVQFVADEVQRRGAIFL